MKRDELKKLEISDEVVDKVMKLYGQGIEQLKAQSAQQKAKAEELDTQLQEASKTIAGFKKLDVDGIKAAADEWKTKFETTQAEAETRIKKVTFDYALNDALRNAKSKNVKAVKALLDMSELELAKDGSIIGVEKQLEKIRADSDYLFESTEPKQRATGETKSGTVLTDAFTAALMEGAGLSNKGD